ncbi:hypothetical protein DXG01_014363, partial [Tephrocybe rancida]
ERAAKFLAENNYKLCIQKYLAASGGVQTANTVAKTVDADNLTDNMVFNWTSAYAVAASNTLFKQGDNITGKATTNIKQIDLNNKESFELKKWADYKVETNIDFVPANSFGFRPGQAIADGATLLVYMDNFTLGGAAGDADKRVPYWTSPLKYGSTTKNILLPVERMRIFFTQDQTTPGTIISLGTGYEVDIDFTQQKQRVYKLRNDYTWHKVE